MGLPVHFLEVAPGLWRSGQPMGTDQWRWLADNGVQRIAKLNSPAEGSDDGARLVGIDVYALEIPPVGSGSLITQAGGVFEVPTKAVVDGALAVMKLTGTLVHCTHGNDRTGLLVGLYRVRQCGWTKAEAWAEMIAQGYHPELMGLDIYWLESGP